MKKPAGREAPTSPTWLETNRGWKSKNVKPSIAFTISNIRLFLMVTVGRRILREFSNYLKWYEFQAVLPGMARAHLPTIAQICTDTKQANTVNFQICTDLHWYALICTDLHWSAPICTDSKQTNTVLGSKSSKCSLQEGVKPTEPAADINFKTTSRLSNKDWRYYASVLFWI